MSPSTFKLVSWNVARAAGPQLDAVAALVRDYAPDILLLQEATEDSRRLAALLGGHVRFEPTFPIPGGGSEGMALWSAAGLDAPERMPLGGWPWPRVALWCRLGPLTVCNLHLSHLPWQRRRQLRTVVAALSHPLVLAGDFNRPGGCRLPGFRSVLPAGWSFRRGPLRMRLDSALVSPDLAIDGARYLESALSDHRPMILQVGTKA